MVRVRSSEDALDEDEDDGDEKKRSGRGGGGGKVHGEDREDKIDYSFLHPDKITDKKRRRPDHPDYNPRTIYVPQDALKQMSPGYADGCVLGVCVQWRAFMLVCALLFVVYDDSQRQYWEIKSENYDVVLFFKMGKVSCCPLTFGWACISPLDCVMCCTASSFMNCSIPTQSWVCVSWASHT